MKCMMWTCSLVFLITYMFGICFLQGCTGYLKDMNLSVNPSTASSIQKYWGSVGKSMLSLFMATTSGVSWQEVLEPLDKVGPLFRVSFIIYIVFFTFILVNTVTSIFVDST